MGPRGDVLHRKVRHRVRERHAHQSRGIWNIPAPSKRTASSRLLQIPRKQGQHIGPLIVRNDVRSLHASAYSNRRPDQILILTPMPMPRPSPGGRGRAVSVTCQCIFFVEWEIHVQVTPLDRPLPPGEGWGEGLPATSVSPISSHPLRLCSASTLFLLLVLDLRRRDGLSLVFLAVLILLVLLILLVGLDGADAAFGHLA